ncbi:hybrid sensor histidine kinase/response regulator [Oscillatoria acuminata]|uniref:Circadian input-output histidine kinase CikA n=1 Tax=Oscillatoria acuminata PCC 6304 TaxID=56110 RepID=K9TI37_9CYAN|nr:hybrid sensor histidine kinase/response regulator [Oscillatoria acuminata]AFY82068.1 putative ATPase [Oscillatoria acuminata PCC 6304]
MTVILHHYEFLDILHSGARTVIYRAQNPVDGSRAIVKTLKSEYPTLADITRLRHEYQILENLEINSIIRPLGLEPYKNGWALFLEDGGAISLSEWMESNSLSMLKFLEIATALVDALGELHKQNIIHKDIKPQNIIINPLTETVQLIDFSIASRLERENPTLSHPDLLEGTLAYMSPEQTGRMNRSVDYRSDFYSLGVTFYELLTGQLPFTSNDPLELVHRHIAKTPIPPHQINPEIPEAISAVIMKLLAKTAEDRYQSAAGLKFDLKTCQIQLQNLGEITQFIPGHADKAGQLTIPQKLYGRDAEIATLLKTFERVANGNTEVMLVSGYSGIGKTVLVAEVHKPIVRQRGYFISGKFDQFKRNVPFASLIQAFKSLILQLLTERDAQIQIWRERLASALGNNGQVIIEVIPEVELIIGKQPAVPELGATESQNRFSRVFKQFISVFTTKEHPLVLFLDDLQWADSASLKLIELLVSDRESQYFLLLGAYRDNEVSPIHPTIQAIERIEKAGTTLNNLVLQPLTLTQVEEVIADTLQEAVQSKPLAELLFNKTGGNPFFLTQLLKALYQEELLCYDLQSGMWQWNLAQIQAIGITDYNVVELIARNIRKLSEATQQILKLAACIGNTFNLEVLAIVREESTSVTAVQLWSALQQGLILPLSNEYKIPLVFNQEEAQGIVLTDVKVDYKFLHDKVQQAAYSLIPEEEKKQTHLKIGQLLLKNTTAEERKENIFALVNQLNYGIDLLQSEADRDELAALNLIAGQKAKAATAYESAVKYLNVGLALLGEDSWERQYELTFTLHLEAAESEFITTNFERSQFLSDILLAQAKTLLEKVKVYELKIQFDISKNQLRAAIETGISVLEMFGVRLEQTPHQGLVIDNLADLPVMTDPDKIAAMQILNTILAAAYLGHTAMFPVIISTMINLSIQYGQSAHAAYAYTFYGGLLCGGFDDIDSGYRFGKQGVYLLEQFAAKSVQSKIFAVFNALVRHWKEPLRKGLKDFNVGIQSGLEVGDIEFACHNAAAYCNYLFFSGEYLEKVVEQEVKYTKFSQKLKQNFDIYYIKVYYQLVEALRAKNADKFCVSGAISELKKILPSMEESQNETLLYCYYVSEVILFYLFKDYQQTVVSANLASNHAQGGVGLIYSVAYNFYHSLALLGLYPTAPPQEQAAYVREVTANQEKMANWAYHCPENFQHKYELVEAEKARVLGQKEQATDYYEQGIQGAKEQGYLQDEALGNELAAEFHLSLGRKKIAKTYLTDAYYGYIRWGAKAKVQDLEERYPELLDTVLNPSPAVQTGEAIATITHETIPGTSMIDPSLLDMASVIKASQAISGEILLPNLLEKLMKILIENAGAQKGALILAHGGKWVIEAQGSPEGVQVMQSVPLHQSNEVAIAAVEYVTRTQKDVILKDASTDEIFGSDAYIVEQHPKSLLCLPILYQGQLSAILYLENNLIAGAFTPRRVEVLKLLSSQSAIALENATLYHSLEQKVQARTQELKTKNDRLEIEIQERQRAEEAADTANRAKSQFLASMSHELRTPLNGILGYAQILNRDKTLSQTQKSGVKIIHKCGEHLLTLINDVLDLSKIEAGKMELQPKEFHLPEFLQSISDICRVRAESKGISLVYEPSSHLPLGVCADEKRLRQVLINLLGNAVKFTEKGGVTFKVEAFPSPTLDPAHPLIILRFLVQDTGIGIEPEQISSIFLPFEQVNGTVRQTEGTGLGLAISSQLVEMMGSSIHLESEVGKGSQFWFEVALPRVENCPGELKESPKMIRGFVGAPRKILVVDDRWENRSVLVNLLTPLGFQVQEAIDGQDCLNQVSSFQPDCIIIDLVMPVMDGFEAMRRIRKIPEVKNVVAIGTSASIFSDQEKSCLNIGCNDFLLKPIRDEQLLSCLRNHLDLEWIYEEQAVEHPESSLFPASIPPQLSEAIAPSPDELAILFDLAMKGELVTIQERVERLVDGDRRYAPFANQVIHLAKTFAEEELLACVQGYMEAGQ